MSIGSQANVVAVEWALTAHPDVAEAAAMAATDADGGDIVRAYVVLRADVEGDAVVAGRLAAHAVESAEPGCAVEIRFVETLPKTRTGKVARWMLEPPSC